MTGRLVLGDHQAVFFLDQTNSLGTVGAGARQYDAAGHSIVFIGQVFTEKIDGHVNNGSSGPFL